MTTRRLLIAIPLAALLLVPIGLFMADHAVTVYATPDMQTPFLRTYAPDRVLDKFKISNHFESTGSGAGAEAGYGFATHSRDREDVFVMRQADLTALMVLLHKDLASSLDAAGAQILEDTGNGVDGFHLRYVAGKSTGTVMIMPPEPIENTERDCRLSPGAVSVRVSIRIEETWFKSGVPTPPTKMSLLSRLPLL